jgi:hypothetical protein
MLQRFIGDPAWYKRLSNDERADLNRRFWAEGRMRLEPWLAPRIDRGNVFLHPNTTVNTATLQENGRSRIELSSFEELAVDEVLLATGYRVDVTKLPFLEAGILNSLQMADGFPVLNERLESSIPGLFFTSMAATRDFGAFFAFTVSARIAASIVVGAVHERLRG